MAGAMLQDPEFAAAVGMTFRHIDRAKGGSITFDAFAAWWRQKDAEDEDGGELSDGLLANARIQFNEHDRGGQGLGTEGLAELLVAFELEGYMELEEPEELDTKDDEHDSDEDVLLDGLDDLVASSEDDDQHQSDASALITGTASAAAGPTADRHEPGGLAEADAGRLHPPRPADLEAAALKHPEQDFHEELQGMKLSELRQKAKELRADRDDVAEALDADDPKVAMVALLMERKEEMDEDRAELEEMKMSELREMAVDLELDIDKMEAALDEDDPKEALINALLTMSDGDSEDEAGEEPEVEAAAAAEEEEEEGIPPNQAVPEGAPAPDAPQGAEVREDGAEQPEQDFHEELQGMKLSELRQKAKELRADRDDVAEALDADDPEVAMVALLMERKEEMDEDRAELEEMDFSELKEMAVDLELDIDKMEAALDEDDPKEALINALLAMAESDEDAGDGLLDGLDELEGADSDAEGREVPQDRHVAVSAPPPVPVPVPVPVPNPPTTVTAGISGDPGEEMLELDHEELKAVFASIDLDGNGVIDPDEFTTLCNELDSSMTDDDMEDAFDTMDQDADGDISFEDFEDWWLAVADMPVDEEDDDEPVDTQIAQMLLSRVMRARREERKRVEQEKKDRAKAEAEEHARAEYEQQQQHLEELEAEASAKAARAEAAAAASASTEAAGDGAGEFATEAAKAAAEAEAAAAAVAEAAAAVSVSFEESAFSKEFGAVALIITRMAQRKIMQRKAKQYMEQQRRLRAEQEYMAAGEPDARAKAVGWDDADHLARVQYEADLADSRAGTGAGLDWGAGLLPQFSPPQTFFVPTISRTTSTQDSSAGPTSTSSDAVAGPATTFKTSKHTSLRDFAHTLGHVGQNILHQSESYSQLGELHKMAQRQALKLHQEKAEDLETDRTRFLLLERQRLRKEEYRDAMLRAERSQLLQQRAKPRRSYKWRQARKVMPMVIMLCDLRRREAARTMLEADIALSDEASYYSLIEHVEEYEALLHSNNAPERIAEAAVQLTPPLSLWETKRANDTTTQTCSWRCLADNASGTGTGTGTGLTAYALLEYYDEDVTNICSVETRETEPPVKAVEEVTGDTMGDSGQMSRAATALAMLLAITSAADTKTKRLVAAAVCPGHARGREIVADLIRILNDSQCGGLVWENALTMLSFVIDDTEETKGEAGAPEQKVSNADLVLSPADQRVLLDVLLRQQEYVPLSSMKLWRSWLKAVHAIICFSTTYSSQSLGRGRHRRLDILCALETLQRNSRTASGLHSTEQWMLGRCIAVVHTEKDEVEMQKQLVEKAKPRKSEQKSDTQVMAVGQWLKRRGLQHTTGGRMNVMIDHTRAICASLKDNGYRKKDWLDVLKKMERHEIRQYISEVNKNYSPDGHRKVTVVDASENRSMGADDRYDELDEDEMLGPPPDQEAIDALRKAATADAKSKKSKDVDALLETALLYMEADKAIDMATASRRVTPLVANTLETKQQAVHKRLRSLRKKVGADVLDTAWTKRRLGGAVADSASFFPAQGLYWMITGDETYGEQQGPVGREDMVGLMEMEAFWNESPRLQVYYAENPNGWQPWSIVRPTLNL